VAIRFADHKSAATAIQRRLLESGANSSQTPKGDRTMTERKQYIEKAKAKLDQWNADIDKFKAKVTESDADAKIEYSKQLDEMRNQRDKAKAKLTELHDASDDAWRDMKSGFDKAWVSISGAYDSAKSQFK
jgi:chromosome segregation ATPase